MNGMIIHPRGRESPMLRWLEHRARRMSMCLPVKMHPSPLLCSRSRTLRRLRVVLWRQRAAEASCPPAAQRRDWGPSESPDWRHQVSPTGPAQSGCMCHAVQGRDWGLRPDGRHAMGRHVRGGAGLCRLGGEASDPRERQLKASFGPTAPLHRCDRFNAIQVQC